MQIDHIHKVSVIPVPERPISVELKSLKDFADSGIYELISFLAEARALAATLQRVATQLERDPARFLFGDANKGFQPAK